MTIYPLTNLKRGLTASRIPLDAKKSYLDAISKLKQRGENVLDAIGYDNYLSPICARKNEFRKIFPGLYNENSGELLSSLIEKAKTGKEKRHLDLTLRAYKSYFDFIEGKGIQKNKLSEFINNKLLRKYYISRLSNLRQNKLYFLKSDYDCSIYHQTTYSFVHRIKKVLNKVKDLPDGDYIRKGNEFVPARNTKPQLTVDTNGYGIRTFLSLDKNGNVKRKAVFNRFGELDYYTYRLNDKDTRTVRIYNDIDIVSRLGYKVSPDQPTKYLYNEDTNALYIYPCYDKDVREYYGGNPPKIVQAVYAEVSPHAKKHKSL
jgi:hypothetical protein